MKRWTGPAAALLCLALLAGCKPEEEIIMRTPQPETKQVVVNNELVAPDRTVLVEGAATADILPDSAVCTALIYAGGETEEAAVQACVSALQRTQSSLRIIGVLRADMDNTPAAAVAAPAPAAAEAEAAEEPAPEPMPEAVQTALGESAFVATAELRVTVHSLDIYDRVASTLDNGVNAKLLSARFLIADFNSAYRQALSLAVSNAYLKADAMASAGNARLNGVAAIEELPATQLDPLVSASAAETIPVSAAVRVTYLIKN